MNELVDELMNGNANPINEATSVAKKQITPFEELLSFKLHEEDETCENLKLYNKKALTNTTTYSEHVHCIIGIIHKVSQGQNRNLQITINDVHDKSRVIIFLINPSNIHLTEFLRPNMIILVRNCKKKVMNNLDIMVDLRLNKFNLRILGEQHEEINDFCTY